MKISVIKLSLFILFVGCSAVTAQTGSSNEIISKGMYFELVGSGGFYSLNHETIDTKARILRIGFSVASGLDIGPSGPIVVVPHSWSKFILKAYEFNIETGLGGSLAQIGADTYYAAYCLIGLRGQDEIGKKSFYRITIYPGYIMGPDNGFFITAGLSIGRSFKKK